MLSPKHLVLHNTRIFSTRFALLIALVGGLLLTGFMLLTNLDKGWILDDDFHSLFAFASNTAILFAVLALSFSIIKSGLPLVWKYILGATASLVVGIALSLLLAWLYDLLYNDQPFRDHDSINLTRDIVTTVIAILISLTLFNIMRHQQLRIEKEQLQTENLMVRYEALENQLDPHFLFNSLNTLSGLIGSDDNKAKKYLQQLASSYRYIMQSRHLVDLDQELQFVKSYCEMIQIRYGENITFVRDINPDVLHYQIIPISIQLLIENALKHNTVSSRHPLTVTLSTTDHNTFRVSNPIQPKQENTSGMGLGLANLAKRYSLLCDKEIDISKNNGIFSVEVPVIPPSVAASIINKRQYYEDRNH
ncbi:MAG: histidine kinase [Bacteroidales bacterium]|nr:histidine kinase [Bacteroidales bacterium]